MDDQSLLDPPFLKLRAQTAPTEKIIFSQDKGWPVTLCVHRVYRGTEEFNKLHVLTARAQLLCDGIDISHCLKIDCESKTDPSPSLQFPSDDGNTYFTICDGFVKLSIKVIDTKGLKKTIPNLYSNERDIRITFYGSSTPVNPCTLSGIQIKSRTRPRCATTTSSSTLLAEKPLNKEEPKQFSLCSYWMNEEEFTYPFGVENTSPSPCNPSGGRAAHENRKKRKQILQTKRPRQPKRQRTASEKTEHESTKRSLRRESERERKLKNMVVLTEHPYETPYAWIKMHPNIQALNKSDVSITKKKINDATTLSGRTVDGGNPQDYTYTSLYAALTAAMRKGGVVLIEADRGLSFVYGCGIASEWYYVSGLLQRSEFYLMDIDDRHIAMAKKRLEYMKTKLDELQLVDRIHLETGNVLGLFDGLAPQYPLWRYWIKDNQKFDEELELSKYWLVWTTTPDNEVVATIVDSLFELMDYTPFISWMNRGDTIFWLAGLTEQMAMVFVGLDYSVTTGKPLNNGGARPKVLTKEIDRICLSITHSLVFTQSEGKTVSLTVLIIQNAEQFRALLALRRRTVARRDEAEVMKTLPDRKARYARLKELDIPVPRPKQKTLEEALVHAERMTVIQLKKAVRDRKLLSSSACNKLRRPGLVKVVQDSIRQQYIIISSSPEEAFTN